MGNITREKETKIFTCILKYASFFLLLVLTTVASSGSVNALAEVPNTVSISDYAYLGEDYAGIDRAAKSVFYVEILDSDKQYIGSGSGFVMFDEGLFITNRHVINGASYLLIMDDDGNQYVLDLVIISDAEHDIAILYFPEGKFYRSLPYDTSFENLMRGQAVLAIGSPKGLPGTVSDGIISAFPKFPNEDTRYIQITAPISHGSSGGCLLNSDLKVIGVTSAGVDEGQNLGFAIPITIVEQLYNQWDKTSAITLGSVSSWDTVGSGIHSRVSGSLSKPRTPIGTSATEIAPPLAAISSSEPEQHPDSDPINLDFIQAQNAYILTINGQSLDWNQSSDSAVQILTRNGLSMTPHTNSNGTLYYSSAKNLPITICRSIKVEYLSIDIRTSSDKPDEWFVFFSINSTSDPDIMIKSVMELHQTIQEHLGPPDKLYVFTHQKTYEYNSYDITTAVEMIRNKTDLAYMVQSFKNLSFFVTTNGINTDILDLTMQLFPDSEPG